jgi:hypothetical protein
VYYEDDRFKDKAYSVRTVNGKTITTGIKPPTTRAELEKEAAGLPSQTIKRKVEKRQPAANTEPAKSDVDQFDPLDFIGCYETPDQLIPPDQMIPESCKNFVDIAVQENGPASIPEALALDPAYFSGD